MQRMEPPFRWPIGEDLFSSLIIHARESSGAGLPYIHMLRIIKRGSQETEEINLTTGGPLL